ncbi:hypothetical protein QUW13_05080 [Enterococcus hirae]|nr:hypothetical protein [Enterococcus hirae]
MGRKRKWYLFIIMGVLGILVTGLWSPITVKASNNVEEAAKLAYDQTREGWGKFTAQLTSKELGGQVGDQMVATLDARGSVNYWERDIYRFSGTHDLVLTSAKSADPGIIQAETSSKQLRLTRGTSKKAVNTVDIKVTYYVDCQYTYQMKSNGYWIDSNNSAGSTKSYTETISVKLSKLQDPGVITTQDAAYTLGERWDSAAQRKSFKSAAEADGREIPFDDKKMVPVIPKSVSDAIHNERIDTIFADKVTWTFHSETGTVQSTSNATANFGNTIILHGLDMGSTYDAAGAFALIQENNQLKIVATSGERNVDLPLHIGFIGAFYTGIAHLDMSNDVAKDLTNISVKNYQWATGDILKQHFLDLWGTQRVEAVQAGDIVKAENVDGNIGYTQDSIYHGIDQLKNNKEIFFEITARGYRPLAINQLTPKTLSVGYGATHAAIDHLLANAIDTAGYQNITVEKFTEYPDTTVSGQTTTKVLVSEKLQSGKKATYIYEVPVTVEQGSLQFDTIPAGVDFGQVPLGSRQKLFWPKDQAVVVTNNRDSADGWAVETALKDSKSGDFPNYVKWIDQKDHSEKNLNEVGEIYQSANKGKTAITASWGAEQAGIVIDYSTVEAVRSDEATIEWKLVSTSKGVTP